MATLQEFAIRIAEDLPEMGRLFEGVVTGDPLSAASFVMGALLVGGASAVLGYLAFGATLDLLGAGTAR